MGRRGREAGPAQWAFSGDRSAPVIAGTTENLLQLPLLLYFYINSASVFECSDFDIFSFCTFQSSSSFFFSFFFGFLLRLEIDGGKLFGADLEQRLDHPRPLSSWEPVGVGKVGVGGAEAHCLEDAVWTQRVMGVDGQESPRSPDPCSGAGTW